MSKGIVKKTPAITKRQHPGKLLVKEIEGADNQHLLETEIDFYTPDFFANTDDYVEFALNLAGWAHLTRTVYCKGKVLSLVNPITGVPGTLEVTLANPNSGIQRGAILSYINGFAIPLEIGDYVEFNKITNSAQEQSCHVVRLIECVGSVASLSGANSGSITIRSIGENGLGLAAGSPLPLTLSYVGNAPFHINDFVEYRVVGPNAGKFVQIVSRA